jgi:S-(hydroxymethyl)glutathione dehydrogenase/alcohol dehydrogenase
VRRNDVDIPTMAGLGTMAEVMTVNEASVVKVSTDLPDDQLALIGCGVTTGVGSALWTAGVRSGSTVAVFGCGGVGLSVLQGARIAGAAELIAIDPMPLKRAAALNVGATHCVDPTADDPVARVLEIAEGRGAEFTFDAAGTLDTMHGAYNAACRGGTVTMIGALSPELEFRVPANGVHMHAKRILGSVYGSAQALRDIPRLVRLVETGRLDLQTMVSRRIGLDDVNNAFTAMEQGEVIRSVIVP